MTDEEIQNKAQIAAKNWGECIWEKIPTTFVIDTLGEAHQTEYQLYLSTFILNLSSTLIANCFREEIDTKIIKEFIGFIEQATVFNFEKIKLKEKKRNEH